ncbi:hypothetical protein [Aquimarina sp. AU58]|uniref:hypothetical protein n=1 Tax=Aquimarina sp. AU58 TaxID=1874112 RepID=UPI000D6417D5|nr:hypothetical protein [Aquimarina sp. AU58]
MKKLVFIIVFGFHSFVSYSQGQEPVVSNNEKADHNSLPIKDLETPSSPAFMLLDKAPSAIERPNSTKAFALSIINSFENTIDLPKNYAVEFTPFWFFKNKNMTALKYLGYKGEKGDYKQNYFNGLQMFSISLAFVNTLDSITNQEINNISVGARTNIISIKRKKDSDSIKTKYIKVLKKIDSIEKNIPKHDPFKEDLTTYNKRVKKYLDSITTKELLSQKEKLSDIIKRKDLFALDGAIAYNSIFTENDFSSSRFGRLGIWLTANYSYKKNENTYLNIYATGRYLKDGTNKINDEYIKQDFYDIGGKLEFEYKKISLSYEYLYRIADNKDTYRSNGVLKYKINDKIFLTGSFGKNFGDNDNLISLLGINWGFLTGEEKTILKEN